MEKWEWTWCAEGAEIGRSWGEAHWLASLAKHWPVSKTCRKYQKLTFLGSTCASIYKPLVQSERRIIDNIQEGRISLLQTFQAISGNRKEALPTQSNTYSDLKPGHCWINLNYLIWTEHYVNSLQSKWCLLCRSSFYDLLFVCKCLKRPERDRLPWLELQTAGATQPKHWELSSGTLKE